ncbi:unnamed protein product [Acanthoscelides obtectus]|uniref:Renin receptor n=1 Tax=Acanthoscelides obtectus TaxID=200917 RepID=A0A9P0M677_ACAOB|nr:unnamed protein product [Acanthoscelides obtectus]CAK1630761.1 Renin receptor [Acanthoscelides obtectus]
MILKLWYLCCLATLTTNVHGAGEFSVLHHPPNLVFKGHDHLRESTLIEAFTAALGFSTEHYSNWQGMYIEAPFELAEAIVTIAVDGVSDIGQQKGHHFPLKTDVGEDKIFQHLERRISSHFPEQGANLVRIDLANGLEDIHKYGIFKEIHGKNSKHIAHKALKIDVDEDRQFLKEITLLHEIAEKVAEGVIRKDNIPDIFWFRFDSLHALSDLHGPNSTEAMEAKQLLNDVIMQLNAAFTKAYGDNALITVITSDSSHTRKARSVLQSTPGKDDKDDKSTYNLASYYNKDYPVIFNIILWFGVMMVFSLLAICIAIGNMDPGRDSIIYRMTSTRMKKDN